jgi:hypothetical protein
MSSLYAHKGWRAAWASLKPRAAPTLALLGNCVSLASDEEARNSYKFLKKCAATWDKVFIVPGPAELSSHAALTATDQLQQLREFCDSSLIGHVDIGRYPITLMDQAEYYYSHLDIVILAASGWADCSTLEKFPVATHEADTIWVADAGGVRKIQPDDLTNWHMDDMAWLQERVTWWKRQRPAVRVVLMTHSLSSPYLLNSGLPKEAYERIYMDVMPFTSTDPMFAKGNIYAWLCGATGSCTSGFMGPKNRVFSSVNALYAKGSATHRNPQFLPDRKLEIPILQAATPSDSSAPIILR